MLDIGFTEILLLGAVALIVLGPEKLPHAARMAGAWYGRIRRSISTIQAEIEQEVNLAEMRKRMNDELEKIRIAEQSLNSEVNTIHQNIQGDAVSLEKSNPSDALPEETAALPSPADMGSTRHPYVLLSASERDTLVPQTPFQFRKASHRAHETILTSDTTHS